MSPNVGLARGGREPAVSSPAMPGLSTLPLCVLRSLVSRGGLSPPASEGRQLCTGSFRMPQKLLAAPGVTHVQAWRKVGESWQPSEITQARRDSFFSFSPVWMTSAWPGGSFFRLSTCIGWPWSWGEAQGTSAQRKGKNGWKFPCPGTQKPDAWL